MPVIGITSSSTVVAAGGAVYKGLTGGIAGTVSAISMAFNVNVEVAVGDLIVVRACSDNLSATTPTFTCADSAGNVYTTHVQKAQNATAAAGIAGAIMASKATVLLPIGGTVTVTLSGAAANRLARGTVYTGVNNVMRSTPVSASGASTAAASPASGTVNAGDLVIGYVAVETKTVMNGDSDTTNGAWSTNDLQTSGAGGGDAASTSAVNQHKIPTAAGAQTINITTPNTDWAAMIAVFQAA